MAVFSIFSFLVLPLAGIVLAPPAGPVVIGLTFFGIARIGAPF
jgi:hypothetical protein